LVATLSAFLSVGFSGSQGTAHDDRKNRGDRNWDIQGGKLFKEINHAVLLQDEE